MTKSLILAVATAALLSACGGSTYRPPVTEEVPNSASESVGGFISYLKELIASSADTLEPVDISNVTPPTDDSGDPTPIE